MYLKKIVGTAFLVKKILGNKIPWKQLSLEMTFLEKEKDFLATQ
jgi:hypothetical protein